VVVTQRHANAPGIFVNGVGVVSPAGWGLPAFSAAVQARQPLPASELARPGWEKPLPVRRVPAPSPRPAFLTQARLRRTSPISHFAVAAALEALGDRTAQFSVSGRRLGIVSCAMSGCVNYSRRFYAETLSDPAIASPLVFPETVFNAPASHIAALLGTLAINYTLVGDPGTFLQGLALAADWLTNDMVDGCLVVGAEEIDWITADAYRHFNSEIVMSEGAGAVFLSREADAGGSVELESITDSHPYTSRSSPREAIRNLRAELPVASDKTLLCDSTQNLPDLDAAELEVWETSPSPRISPKALLGEGLMAGAAWQCVAAIDSLSRGESENALVSVAGCNQQAIGASFLRRAFRS
jgi:hypothetical protein